MLSHCLIVLLLNYLKVDSPLLFLFIKSFSMVYIHNCCTTEVYWNNALTEVHSVASFFQANSQSIVWLCLVCFLFTDSIFFSIFENCFELSNILLVIFYTLLFSKRNCWLSVIISFYVTTTAITVAPFCLTLVLYSEISKSYALVAPGIFLRKQLQSYLIL